MIFAIHSYIFVSYDYRNLYIFHFATNRANSKSIPNIRQYILKRFEFLTIIGTCLSLYVFGYTPPVLKIYYSLSVCEFQMLILF